MKKNLTILFVLLYQLSFGQAREYLTRDTITHMGGQVTKDTVQIVDTDSTIRRYNETRYHVTLGVNPNILSAGSTGSAGAYWLQNAIQPTKIYYKVGYVGIGIDSPRALLEIAKSIAPNAVDTGLLLSNANGAAPTSSNQYYSPSIYFQSKGYSVTPGYTGYNPTVREYVYPTTTAYATPNMKWEYQDITGIWREMMKLQVSGSAYNTGLTISGAGNAMNIGVTPNQIDNNNNSQPVTLSNTSGGAGIRMLGGNNTLWIKNASLLQTPQATAGFGINDYAAITTADNMAELDVAAKWKGVLIPRMNAGLRDSMTSAPASYILTSGGSGYTSRADGTYNSLALTTTTGVGTGAYLSATVTNGVITALFLTFGQTPGKNYKVGDQLTIAGSQLGGAGSGAVITVGSLTTVAKSMLVIDTTSNQLSRSISADNWTGRVITISSATYNPFAYGADYIFTGSTGSYTLPPINGKIMGRQNEIHIINEGSGSITINSDAGSTLYTTGLVSSISIAAGATAVLFPTGANFKVKYNQ